MRGGGMSTGGGGFRGSVSSGGGFRTNGAGGGSVAVGRSGGGNYIYAGRGYRTGTSGFRDSDRVATAPSGRHWRGGHWRGGRWYGPGIAFGTGIGLGYYGYGYDYDDYPYDTYAYSSDGYYDEDGCFVHWVRGAYGWRQVRSCG
jgi:hypothetical protein